ncbi:hypothetical protein N7466_003109 [Penicillium verhagenii]|uniref:uncharacterized protein n=1 Tax=Penicillium verhagenii TaxID=1562060 RepID=UPI002545B4BC|nr:uncharacterized protein N7466_003109 [Penicillium verhagenii]KAJ5936659.1 hypothetical protein N7466_003109 [Penicillium verhagenii]
MHAPASAVAEACGHILAFGETSIPSPSLFDVGNLEVVKAAIDDVAFDVRDNGKLAQGKVFDMIVDSVRNGLTDIMWLTVSKKRKASSGLSIIQSDDTSTSGQAQGRDTSVPSSGRSFLQSDEASASGQPQGRGNSVPSTIADGTIADYTKDLVEARDGLRVVITSLPAGAAGKSALVGVAATLDEAIRKLSG